MQVNTVRDLGAAVREARSRRRLTQADLAARAGVSRDWLVRLEQGQPRLEVQLVFDTLAAVGLVLTTSDADESAENRTETDWDTVFTGLAVDPSNLPSPENRHQDG